MLVPFVLLPFFVQVALIFGLLFTLGAKRLSAIRRGDAKIADVALDGNAWPQSVRQVGAAYRNQFELPLLFLLLAPLAILTRKADLLFVVLSWIFVIFRLAHAGVHATSNHVPTRFRLFAASAVVLLIMWIVFALQILLGF